MDAMYLNLLFINPRAPPPSARAPKPSLTPPPPACKNPGSAPEWGMGIYLNRYLKAFLVSVFYP